MTLEYFDVNDLIYINEMIRTITLEESDERGNIIRKSNPPLLLKNNKDASSSLISTIPTTRGCFVQSNVLPNDEQIFTSKVKRVRS